MNPVAPPESQPPARTGLPVEADTPARVLRKFRLVFNAVRTHFREIEKRAGLGGAQVWALSVIGSRPGLGTGGLAEAMDIHQSTASNLVRQLVKAGLVESIKGQGDRRSVALRLLEAGQDVLRRTPGPHAGVLPAALASLDAATLSRLDGDLGALIRLLDTDEHGAGIPLADA